MAAAHLRLSSFLLAPGLALALACPPARSQALTQTISFGAPPNLALGAQATISASASSGLSVSFTSLTPAVCSVAGATVTGIAGGNCIISADQSGNTGYAAAAPVTLSFAVGGAAPGPMTLNLQASWNLLGNSTSAPIDVAATFGDAAKIGSVWKWETAASRWAFYTPGQTDGGAAYAAAHGYASLSSIDGGEGYWVSALGAFSTTLPGATALSSVAVASALPAGWSLVSAADRKTAAGFNTAAALSPPAANYVPEDLASVWAWDPVSAKWYFYSPALAQNGTLAAYIASMGYLDFGSRTLDPGAALWVNKPAPAMSARPGFIKGVFTLDVGGFMPDVYASGLFEPTYDRIAKTAGANLVAISDPVKIISFDAATAKVRLSKFDNPDDPQSFAMLTREQYTRLVTAAHSRNLAFMMQLGLYTTNSAPQAPWDVDAGNTAFWDAWFAAYTSIVVEYAGIARDLKIEYLSLGMNHGYMSLLPVKYWRDLVGAVRATGYTGKLVYQAMTNPETSWGEFFGFNGSCCADLTLRDGLRMEFVKLFDVIVIDVYNIARDRVAPAAIARDEMKQGFRWLLDQVRNYPTTVMFMVGTPSIDGGAVYTDFIEPCVECNSLAPNRVRNAAQQADVYQALAEVVDETPTGNGNVMGLLSWGYWFTDNPLLWTPPAGRSYAMACDKTASIRGKPAETVLKWFFDRW